MEVCYLGTHSLLRTGLGRGRAWLHLALMQKTMADYMTALLDRRGLLRSVPRSTLSNTGSLVC